MLALPSYAAVIVDGGIVGRKSCSHNIFNIPTLLYTNRTTHGGHIMFEIGFLSDQGVQHGRGVRLSSGIDNPGLFEFAFGQGDELKCPGAELFLGFTYTGLDRLQNLAMDQKVTAEIDLPGVGDGYFDFGNGLAMKLFVNRLFVKDHGVIDINQPVMPGTPLTLFETDSEPLKNRVGPTFTARLKVIGEVLPRTDLVEVGRVLYRATRTKTEVGDYEEVSIPLRFQITVDQASLRTCTLDSEHRDFSLIAVAKPDLDAGRELQGGQITLGPVTCPAGVDVKASFYDHNSTGGLNDYLRTVYTDDELPSQYAFKFFDTAGGPALKFLPIAQWNAGYDSTVVSDGVGVGVGVAANDTTIDFSDGTTTVEGSIEKNFIVKYVKTVEDGEDHAGAIKGLMTVQFLYY
jgi:hypothetical protein